LLTSLRDALTTLRASDASPNTGAAASESEPKKPQISLADLAKKAAESDAKAHKWEIEELRNTIAGLRDELSEFCFALSFFFRECRNVDVILCVEKVKAEKKLSPTSHLQDIPAIQDKLASHLPLPNEAEAGPALPLQHDMKATNLEPNVSYLLFPQRV
jgi:hypothetical protein